MAPHALPPSTGSPPKAREEGLQQPTLIQTDCSPLHHGEELERLMAHRLAWIAIKHKVLHPQQFRALPCRSATDLAAVLVHDIEESWARGLSASMLTFEGVIVSQPSFSVSRAFQHEWGPYWCESATIMTAFSEKGVAQ